MQGCIDTKRLDELIITLLGREAREELHTYDLALLSQDSVRTLHLHDKKILAP